MSLCEHAGSVKGRGRPLNERLAQRNQWWLPHREIGDVDATAHPGSTFLAPQRSLQAPPWTVQLRQPVHQQPCRPRPLLLPHSTCLRQRGASWELAAFSSTPFVVPSPPSGGEVSPFSGFSEATVDFSEAALDSSEAAVDSSEVAVDVAGVDAVLPSTTLAASLDSVDLSPSLTVPPPVLANVSAEAPEEPSPPFVLVLSLSSDFTLVSS
ncbi:hypothetical protein MTO96_017805 [Rhipicephalus appendiculatus]